MSRWSSNAYAPPCTSPGERPDGSRWAQIDIQIDIQMAPDGSPDGPSGDSHISPRWPRSGSSSQLIRCDFPNAKYEIQFRGTNFGNNKVALTTTSPSIYITHRTTLAQQQCAVVLRARLLVLCTMPQQHRHPHSYEHMRATGSPTATTASALPAACGNHINPCSSHLKHSKVNGGLSNTHLMPIDSHQNWICVGILVEIV